MIVRKSDKCRNFRHLSMRQMHGTKTSYWPNLAIFSPGHLTCAKWLHDDCKVPYDQLEGENWLERAFVKIYHLCPAPVYQWKDPNRYIRMNHKNIKIQWKVMQLQKRHPWVQDLKSKFEVIDASTQCLCSAMHLFNGIFLHIINDKWIWMEKGVSLYSFGWNGLRKNRNGREVYKRQSYCSTIDFNMGAISDFRELSCKEQ